MSRELTIEEVKQSLTSHATEKGLQIREKYGPHIGWKEMLQILADRALVRYPCEIVFDATPLAGGEFAYPVAKGQNPEEGFTMYVHPFFELQPDRLPYLVLYQLVRVNYGPFASADDAEAFGSSVLGLSRDGYYRAVCALADELAEFNMVEV